MQPSLSSQTHRLTKMSRRRISWADLPLELLFKIAERLEFRPDVEHFRSVCTSWRLSTPASHLSNKSMLSHLLPHKLLTLCPPLLKKIPKYDFEPESIPKPLILVASSVLLIKPIRGKNFLPWLVTIEEFHPGKVFLRRPLTRSVMYREPVSEQLCNDKLDMSSIEVVEIGKTYVLRYDDIDKELFDDKQKVLLLVDPNCQSSPTINDCKSVVLYANGALALIRLKDEQVQEPHFKNRKFDDIIIFKSMVYMIDRAGRLYWIDAWSNQLKFCIVVEEHFRVDSIGDMRGRLVESSGELYLVYRSTSVPIIYKLDEEKNTWVELYGIGGDRILFASVDYCFFAPTSVFPGWIGNCIVLYKGSFPHYNNFPHSTSDYVIRWPIDSLYIDVYRFGAKNMVEPSELYRGMLEVFWPPPSWVLSNTKFHISVSKEDNEANSGSPGKNLNDSGNLEGGSPQFNGNTNTGSHISALHSEKIPDKATASSRPYNVATKPTEYGRVLFEGYYVNSDMIPMLEKIWAKHGNILEGNVIQHNDFLVLALESIAEVVEFLESGLDRFTDLQANLIRSTLHDVRVLCINLSWMAPYVEKAMVAQIAYANEKKSEENAKEIDEAIARMEELRTVFLAEIEGPK